MKNTLHTFILGAIQRDKIERIGLGISSAVKMAHGGITLLNKPYLYALGVVEKSSSIKPNYIKMKQPHERENLR